MKSDSRYIHLHCLLHQKSKSTVNHSYTPTMSYGNGYNGMPMQGGGGGYGGGYGGSSGGNFPPGMRGFNGGSPGFNNRGGGRGRGRRGKLDRFLQSQEGADPKDDRGRGRGGHGGGGGDRQPESTGVRFRKMVIKLGDEEVS